LASHEENTPPSISERFNYIAGSHRNSLARPIRHAISPTAIA
jgi:hypothetical protein